MFQQFLFRSLLCGYVVHAGFTAIEPRHKVAPASSQGLAAVRLVD